MKLLGSAPISGGGLFESLVADRKQQHPPKSAVRRKKRGRRPTKSLKSATSVEELGEHIRAEFESMTGVDLSPARIEVEERPECTTIRFAMNFKADDHASTSGSQSKNFARLIQKLAETVRGRRSQRRKADSLSAVPTLHVYGRSLVCA